MRRLPPRIVALTPGDLERVSGREFLARASVALAAGLPGLMLREPELCDRDFLELARELALRCKAVCAWFCVHDRAHLAIEVGADALHLGFRSLPTAAARRVLPGSMALGISTHESDAADEFAGSDYRMHGPVFDTPSKRGLKAPIGLEGIERAVRGSPIPLLAIGGLLAEHFCTLRALGAHGACARAAFFQQDDPLPQTAQRVAAWLEVSAKDSA